MLQRLNERIQGLVAWMVITIIALTFTLFGLDYYMQSHQASDVEVTVNGEPISKQALEINYRRTRQRPEPSLTTMVSEAAIKKQVLNEMTVNLATVQAAHRAGFSVSPLQADAAIVNIPQFQHNGRFSTERYQQALTGAMFTPESFQKEVKQGMLLNQQRFAFIGSAFVLPAESIDFIKLYMQTRDYQYLSIPSSLFTTDEQISDDEITQYYQAHKKEFITPEKVSIDFIELSMDNIKKNITLNQADVRRFYDENQENFLTPIQWQVAHILFVQPNLSNLTDDNSAKKQAQEAYLSLQKHPTQFSEWTKTRSADKLAASNQGILPWIEAGTSTFDKPLSQLTQIGQISKPVRTSYGYEIFKLVDYQPAAIKPFEQVKAQISAQLMSQLAQSRYTHALEKLTDLSYQTPDSLVPVAKTLGLSIEHTLPFSRHGSSTNVTKNKQVVNAAFSHDVLTLGNNSDPIQLNNDGVVVLRVNQHRAATKKSQALAKPIIIRKLALIKAQQQAEKQGQAIINSDVNNLHLPEFLASKHLFWQQVKQASRDSDSIDTVVNELAFSLLKPKTRQGQRLANGDYVVVQLETINNGEFDKLDKEQQANIIQQIETNNGLMDYELYVSDLVRQTKIEQQ